MGLVPLGLRSGWFERVAGDSGERGNEGATGQADLCHKERVVVEAQQRAHGQTRREVGHAEPTEGALVDGRQRQRGRRDHQEHGRRDDAGRAGRRRGVEDAPHLGLVLKTAQ